MKVWGGSTGRLKSLKKKTFGEEKGLERHHQGLQKGNLED